MTRTIRTTTPAGSVVTVTKAPALASGLGGDYAVHINVVNQHGKPVANLLISKNASWAMTMALAAFFTEGQGGLCETEIVEP